MPAYVLRRIMIADLVLLRLSMKKILPFITAADPRPTLLGLDSDALRQRFLPPPKQLDFDAPKPAPEDFQSVRSGEI